MSERKYPLNGTHYTEADDLEMLGHPEDWPPQLHVKRGHPADEHGVVELGLRVDASQPIEVLIVHRRGGLSEIAYDNATVMVADGWRVD